MATQHEDATRVITGHDRPWLPVPGVPKGEAQIKVLNVDEDLKKVVFKFRFSPGCELVPHTHHCHAVAYTISGEWEYEGMKLPEEAIAYEPVDSTHTPSSENGAELVVVLSSDSDKFLLNHMPDGSEVELDLAFFSALEGVESEEDLQRLAAEAGL